MKTEEAEGNEAIQRRSSIVVLVQDDTEVSVQLSHKNTVALINSMDRGCFQSPDHTMQAVKEQISRMKSRNIKEYLH